MTASIIDRYTEKIELAKRFYKINTKLIKEHDIDVREGGAKCDTATCKQLLIVWLKDNGLKHIEIGELMCIRHISNLSYSATRARRGMAKNDPLYMKWHGIIETGLKDINNK